MAVEIKLPALGESITEATIARWLKQDGESVRAGQAVCEVETEKATQEVTAPQTGRLRTSAKEGDRLPIGAVIGRIEPGAVPEPVAPANATKPEPMASPSAKRLAAEEKVPLAQVQGTGREGRVTKEDVVNYLDQRPNSTPAPVAEKPPAPVKDGKREETRQRMSALRQRIGERLIQAQQSAAILTTFNETDLSAVMALRSRYKEAFQKKHGVGLGFMSFFVKAAVEALRAFPLVNSRIEGGDIVTPSYQDIGVAVSTDKGLMVPVLRDAGQMTFAQIEKTIVELAEKARSGKITPDDLRGGTFTITNGGVFGSLLSTPLLNPPQTGILGMHTIQKRPIAVDDQVVIRPMMYLALSYDHRLIDGREAVSFLVRIKECVESPERLLLEV